MKTSDVFKLPLELREDLAHFSKSDTCYFKVESVKSRDEELQVTYCIHQAINNYDRLLEENAKLRKVLTQLQIEGGLGIARHRQIDRLLNQLKEQNNEK